LGSTATHEPVNTEARTLVDCIQRIYARGWCEGTSGNFSRVLRHDPFELLITSTGLDKGRITVDDLLLVGADGRPRDDQRLKPSAETLLHVTIVHSTGASAILHTHSVWGTLLGERFLEARGLTISGYEMLKGIEGVGGHRDQLYVPVVKNSQNIPELAETVAGVLRRRPGLRGFLIAGHGLYTWGEDIDVAYRQVEAFEFLFQVTWRKLAAGPID
jgi:methylthioribulose-1-phosphate dehydratase